MKYRKYSNHSLLNDSKVSEIRLMAMRGHNQSNIAKTFGIHRKTVYNILERNTWDHVPEPVRSAGFPNYLVFPDGRIYSSVTDQFITPNIRSNGERVVRIQNSKGKRVVTPVATLVARGYLGSRSQKPKIVYRDGNPRNTHFTNIQL